MSSSFPSRLEVRDRADGTPEVHLWLEPRSSGRTHDGHRQHDQGRTHMGHPEGDIDAPIDDANAGMSGELNFATALPRGRPDDPMESRGGNSERVPTAGGVMPPQFIDGRSLRVSGRDQNGKNFEQAIWGPDSQSQSWARIGDATGSLQLDDAVDMPTKLGTYQRLLDRHYGNTR
jgi:hypothetical protein